MNYTESKKILTLNSGSLSIKAALYDAQSLDRLLDVRITEIGQDNTQLHIKDPNNEQSTQITATDHQEAFWLIFKSINKAGHRLRSIFSVGHRVVHGGPLFQQPTIITQAVEKELIKISTLAPLHNPACIEGIKAAREFLPHCMHIAVFDTGFHATLPEHVKRYAISNEMSNNGEIRRYGFHGISHEYVTNIAAKVINKPLDELNIISCHLGNGCSINAVQSGKSVETSMGMTPLEGLVMGSRCGDIDPGIMIRLLQEKSLSPSELEDNLNKYSGLLGMTGSQDMSQIQERALDGDQQCQLALEIFIHRARKYIGAYVAVMGGVDVIIFTAGIGENSAYIRDSLISGFSFLGAFIDQEKNMKTLLTQDINYSEISSLTSIVKILVIATDEETSIAKSASRLIKPTQS